MPGLLLSMARQARTMLRGSTDREHSFPVG